jgi:hypothetical protein
VTRWAPFLCYASPEGVIEKAVQGLPHGERIAAVLGSKPPASYKRIDLSLAQHDRQTAQPLFSALTITSHTLGAGGRWPGKVATVCISFHLS